MQYIVVTAVAAIVTFLVVPIVRKVAFRTNQVVQPGGRMAHLKPTPTLGGIGMLVGFGAAMGAGRLLHAFRPVFTDSSEPTGVLFAAIAITAIGVIDDVWNLSAPAKVAGQVLSASLLWIFGVTMFWFKVPFAGIVVLSNSLTPLLTAIWVIAMENAINLIDGLDGLASGIVAIASLAFGLYSLRLEALGQLPSSSIGPLIAFGILGVCVGFLPHNWNPAKIFMGDTGAMLLGLLLAASTSVVGGRTANVSDQTFFFFAPLVIPFVILGVPMADLVFSVLRRTAHRVSFATPDKKHLHHRLMEMGHGPRRAVAILWAWTAILSAFALLPTYVGGLGFELPIAVAAVGVLLYTLFHPDLKGTHSRSGRAMQVIRSRRTRLPQ
ncbi:MAG: undecaprenyl/decaprenyl-phosphate alpha-N-acetylglucosaminyl 1-phosphate transferase [Ferrimicrobium sp.]|nr:undecaprenyl/decaprenyl-phosphate alpha-N-acetylglucosaminyl 1-phosphate transferase [Ferrimicrobium sp.]